MILFRSKKESKKVQDCHNGRGILWCTEMLGEYSKKDNGFKFIHDNTLEPGASIGEHQHNDDEELYIILTGHGVMRVDGVPQNVGPGDICLTRIGHSHDLTNSLESPMHFLVVCANT